MTLILVMFILLPTCILKCNSFTILSQMIQCRLKTNTKATYFIIVLVHNIVFKIHKYAQRRLYFAEYWCDRVKGWFLLNMFIIQRLLRNISLKSLILVFMLVFLWNHPHIFISFLIFHRFWFNV